MNCPKCDSKTVRTHKAYHYTESGLDNIYLEGIDVYKCRCGEIVASIPKVPQLNSLIGLNLLKKKFLLNGKEIKYLRKNVGLTATKLSRYLGVDNATISRWENGTQNISKPHDHLLRLVYSSIKSLPAEEIKHLIEENFKEIEPKQKEFPKYKIPWPQTEVDCAISL